MTLQDRERRQAFGGGARAVAGDGAAPGKRTLVEATPAASAAAPASDGGLPPATRARMEASFGADFSDVRVHQGGEAAAVGARAFAQGSELHFAPGEYRPGTPEGDRLIGHELTHVVQQRDGRVPAAQRKPIQRQSDGQGAGSAPTPVYQYASGTTHGNDCGVASLLVLLHMIAPEYEGNLAPRIKQLRPPADQLPGYLKAYKGESTADQVGMQEKLDVVRHCAVVGAPTAPLDPGSVKDEVLSISQVKAGLSRLLTLVGANVAEDKVDKLLKLGTASGELLNKRGGKIGPGDLNQKPDKDQVIGFLKKHANAVEVVVALGVPQEEVTDPKTGRTVDKATGWGWGGTADPATGYKPEGRDVGPDTAGHFVVIYAYDSAADKFTVLDPSFAQTQYATPDQVIGFLMANKIYTSLLNLLIVPISQLRALVPVPATTAAAAPTKPPSSTPAQSKGAAHGHPDVVDDPALEAEADRMGDRAAAGEPAHASSGAAPAGAVQRQGGGTPTPPAIPAGPIPPDKLQLLTAVPPQAAAVAEWCKVNLLHRDEMQAFWAANPSTRGATLGQMAVLLGRLEFMLGWIQQGGLSTQTTAGWEDQGSAADNQSKAAGDTSSNKGTFPGRYQAIYNGGKGMAGYDWCGMFLGYLYNEVLKLDDGGMGGDGIEGWRGADTILASGNPKIWPTRVTAPNSPQFGAFIGWKDGVPRAGDLAIISETAFTPGLTDVGGDTRAPTHVGMVEEVASNPASGYVRTIDGNAALQPSRFATGSAGSRSANAVSGRAYNLGMPDKPGDDGAYAAYFYNQSRLVAFVRITDRADNFAAPPPTAAGGHGAGGVKPPSGAELLARIAAANAQLQVVLNAQSGTSAPFDATGSVRSWVKGREP